MLKKFLTLVARRPLRASALRRLPPLPPVVAPLLLTFITVAAAPRNLQITPNQAIYEDGARIQCLAEGNPTPSYQWKDLVNGDVTQGAVLIINEDMMNKSYSFQCTATNNYSSISSNFSFSAEGMPITENCYIDYNSLEELISGYWLPV